jgi:hypothetical protein
MTVVAGEGDIRQRLTNDGLASLGLAGPLLSTVWTPGAPSLNVATLRFTVTGSWYAPLAGMLLPVADGSKLGLSGLDGLPVVPVPPPGSPPTRCAVLKVHPQARLRLERLLALMLQTSGPVDQSLRPVPSTILITGPAAAAVDLAQQLAAGEPGMPAGQVSMHDEHGLIVDPFAFGAAVAALIGQTSVLGAPGVPMGAGTPLSYAQQSIQPPGSPTTFVHVVDLHGRPWLSTAPAGVGLYNPPQQLIADLGDGQLHAWPQGAVLAANADPTNATPGATSTRFGFGTVGALGTQPVNWPTLPAGAPPLARDTMRVVAVDPAYHLLGNRTQAQRDVIAAADEQTALEQPPLVRQGSPVTLLPDGRSVLGQFQALFGSGGNTGPIFGASVQYDDASTWTMPATAGPAGAWPAGAAAATPSADQLAALRTDTTVSWIDNSDDVLVTLPAALPAGTVIRLYPIKVLLGTGPDEQPLLRRVDGPGTLVGSGSTQLVLTGVEAGSTQVRADALVTWIPLVGALPQVRFVANLRWPISGSGPRPSGPPAGGNLLTGDFWRGTARNAMVGADPSGGFDLEDFVNDPIGSIAEIIRQLTAPTGRVRETPRLPTMCRNESLLAVQLPVTGGPTGYLALLTGGWLTRDSDTHSYRLGNPGAAGEHEVHAPGLVATGELGFDLWVAAAHRALPLVPPALSNDPVNNWVAFQANPDSVAPAPASPGGTIAGAVLQTVSAFAETPELGAVPDDQINDVATWLQSQPWAGFLTVPNSPELSRQLSREVRSARYGRRDAGWALRRAIGHARELVYVETPLFGATSHTTGRPEDVDAEVDLVAELVTRLGQEPRLRVVILVSRDTPFVPGYEPWANRFHALRTSVANQLVAAGGTVDSPAGPRSRVVIAHPVGAPGRPLVIRTTTVIVDDVWCLTGASTWTRRGLTFDGATDVVLADWALDRGAGTAIRAHRKALMAAHLGVGPTPVGGGVPVSPVGAPTGDWVRLHQPVSAHEVFADLLAGGGRGKLLPLWDGPSTGAHDVTVADPDGRADGSNLELIVFAALNSNGFV